MKTILLLVALLCTVGCSRTSPFGELVEVRIVKVVPEVPGWSGSVGYTIVEDTHTHERLKVFHSEVGTVGEVIMIRSTALSQP